MTNKTNGATSRLASPGRIVWAALIAVVMVASSCSGSSVTTVDSAADREPAVSESSTATDTSEPTGSGDTVAEGVPGSEEFGLTMEGLARRVEDVEAQIGICMAEAGFDYIPVDFDTIRKAQGADGTLPGVNDDDFLAQYGFGLTTLVGQPNAMIETARGQNVSIFDGLSAQDQVAYNRTLLGENVDAPFILGLEEEDFSDTGGCTKEAVAAFFTQDEIAGTYVNPGDVLIDSDPRMADALAAWAECLGDEGYDYNTPDDLDDDLVDQLDAIVGDQDPASLTGESLTALNELQGFERAIAPISEDCDDEHIGPVEEEIEIELYGARQG